MRRTSLYPLVAAAVVRAEYVVASSARSNDVFDGYVSYSIEFSSFPDFAGNKSHPNTYSGTLLDNIGRIAGKKPYIRIGGNTQDYALYNASLPYALHGIIDPSRSPDYPTTITIGPSYFESYGTWKDVKFSHGFNLALGASSAGGWQTLLDTVPLACEALGGGKLYVWGYGNEPDLYSTSAQGPVRPPEWNEAAYVEQWLNGTRQIRALLQQHCPELADEGRYGFMAPSFAGVGNRLKAPAAWALGLNDENKISLFSTHNYISGATSPGVTLQGTLMNHAVTKRSVDAHVAEYDTIHSQSGTGAEVPPMIFGETNSLYNQGRPGLSNTFGAALWGLDFNLYSASVGFKRVHMHMGTNYRYAAWQPISTDLATIGTKAPYYGSIAVAAALGNRPATVVEIPLASQIEGAALQPEAAYAVYIDGGKRLSRLVILNMRSYNTTLDGEGLIPLPDPPPRNEVEYAFRLPNAPPTTTPSSSTTSTTRRSNPLFLLLRATLPQTRSTNAKKRNVNRDKRQTLPILPIRRLLANGSDAITGITFDGWSYAYELAAGRPVRLENVTVGEAAAVEQADGEGEGWVVRVRVPDASAALVELEGLY